MTVIKCMIVGKLYIYYIDIYNTTCLYMSLYTTCLFICQCKSVYYIATSEGSRAAAAFSSSEESSSSAGGAPATAIAWTSCRQPKTRTWKLQTCLKDACLHGNSPFSFSRTPLNNKSASRPWDSHPRTRRAFSCAPLLRLSDLHLASFRCDTVHLGPATPRQAARQLQTLPPRPSPCAGKRVARGGLS